MLSAASNEKSSKYREDGSELLRKEKYYEALVAINKSLCFSEPGSVELSKGFAARSEVFFRIGQFDRSLNNIRLARDHGYPKSEADLLEERQENCEKLLKSQKNELSSFFKLSYPANPKIPFIVESLQIREDEKFGRFIISNKDLQPGDVIAFEEPKFTFFSLNTVFTKCFNCLKSNCLDLIPSEGFVMFCSDKCLNETYKKFNGKNELIKDSLRGNDIRQKMSRIMSDSLAAAGDFNELQKLVENSHGKTVFDFDFSDPDDQEINKKTLICVNSLMPKEDRGIAEYLKTTLNLPEGERKDFFVNFIARIILIIMRNGVKLPGRESNLPEGGLILPFVALFNHSCDPNTFTSFVDNKCFITVNRPIKAGEQIFINYRKTFMEEEKEFRQADLLEIYEFTCECAACVNDYPMPKKLKRIFKKFALPSFGRFGSNEEILDELKENNEFLKQNIEHHPCVETAAILIRNRQLLRTISDRVSFPVSVVRDSQ